VIERRALHWLAASVTVVVCLCDAGARAATPMLPGPVPLPPDTGSDWEPPLPNSEAADWIRLTSGEWLTGSLDRIADETVYFDSEELDDLELDYEDVAEIRAAKFHTYRFDPPGQDYLIRMGTAGLHGGIFRVNDGERIHEYPRAQLVVMVAGAEGEADYWSGTLGVGFTSRTGNSTQTDLSANVMIKRETPLTRAIAEYRGSQSSTNGSETANNHRVNAQLDSYLTRDLFLSAPTLEFFRDPFQNTDVRATVGVGLGYDLLDTPRYSWEIGAGLGFQYTELDTAPVGAPNTDGNAAVTFNTSATWEPNSRLEYSISYRLQLIATQLELTNHNLTTVMSIELWGPFDLDVTWIWDRIEKPAPNQDNQRPASDDYRLSLDLAFDW